MFMLFLLHDCAAFLQQLWSDWPVIGLCCRVVNFNQELLWVWGTVLVWPPVGTASCRVLDWPGPDSGSAYAAGAQRKTLHRLQNIFSLPLSDFTIAQSPMLFLKYFSVSPPPSASFSHPLSLISLLVILSIGQSLHPSHSFSPSISYLFLICHHFSCCISFSSSLTLSIHLYIHLSQSYFCFNYYLSHTQFIAGVFQIRRELTTGPQGWQAPPQNVLLLQVDPGCCLD